MNILLTLLLLMAGGSAGALARFLSQKLAANYTSWPGWIPVLIINVLGSVMIGVAVAWLSIDIKDLHLKDLTPTDEAIKKLELTDLTSLIVIGFCGAFTTFSSFSLDNFLLSINNKGQMFLNIFGTTLLAYGGVTLGWFFGSLAAAS